MSLRTNLVTFRAENATPLTVPNKDLLTDPVIVAMKAVKEAENTTRTLNTVPINAVQSRYLVREFLYIF